jgi:septum formation protein
MEIILASKSPRRSEILNRIRIPHKVIPSNIKELKDEKISPEELVQQTALLKARNIADKKIGLIIGADTIVYRDRIYGKPIDKNDALYMLTQLAGKTHYVYTGIAIIKNITDDYKEICGFEKTELKLRDISKKEIELYLKMGNPYDAAGSYKIQGLASIFIEKIDGCYFNVMGFPIYKFSELLKKLDISIWNLINGKSG